MVCIRSVFLVGIEVGGARDVVLWWWCYVVCVYVYMCCVMLMCVVFRVFKRC